MKCPYPFIVTKSGKFRHREYTNPVAVDHGLVVPCGKCLICQQNRAAEWAARLTHEWQTQKTGCFLTLTYDALTVPMFSDGLLTLWKPDVQLFMKRLRHLVGKTKIKYFLCGEYGTETDRPHYHAIIFGWRPDYGDCKQIGDILTHDDIADCWRLGNVQVSGITDNHLYYVSGYILKSTLYKDNLLSRKAPFILNSQGLGLDYATAHADRVFDMSITAEGKVAPLPRYYIKKLGDVNKTKLVTNNTQRELALLQRLAYNSDDPVERMLAKERVARSRQQNLKEVTALKERLRGKRKL